MNSLLTVFISSSLVSALVSKLFVELMKSSWKHSADKKLELFKGEISQNNSVFLSLVGHNNQAKQKINEKQLEAIQTVWECTRKISSLVPKEVSKINNILTHEEVSSGVLRHSKHGSSFEDDLRAIDKGRYFESAFENIEKIQVYRPFISSRLNILASAYNTMMGRMAYLLFNAAERGEATAWNIDPGMTQIFQAALTEAEMKFLQSGSGIHGFNMIVDLMEQKILSEISTLLSGESIVSETIAIVDKLKAIQTFNHKL